MIPPDITFERCRTTAGILAGGTADWETAAAGQESVTTQFSKNQSIMTSLTPTMEDHCFLTWNTEPDGSGLSPDDYNTINGGCQGFITFYAIYYKTDFHYTGSQQVFTAPVDGWYEVQLWGAKGGNDADKIGGNGGYTKADVKLLAGQYVYVYVGSAGISNSNGGGGGYNGGGNTTYWSGGGGGASDIRLIGGTWSSYGSLVSRILVAAGGGGAGLNSNGGYGGGLIGGSGGSGALGGGQNSAGPGGSFGIGATNRGDGGGGGGGWYGGGSSNSHDQGAGGGSSYTDGYDTAETRNAVTKSGNEVMPNYNGGTMVGNAGPCHVTFVLVDRNIN